MARLNCALQPERRCRSAARALSPVVRTCKLAASAGRRLKGGRSAVVGAALAICCFSVLTGHGFGEQPVTESQSAGNAALPSLLGVPVSGLVPGSTPAGPSIQNPSDGNPEAINRGQKYFSQFNCVGCHAANGAGGMGPALSDRHFIYGSSPGQIYLSILQGRPNGMPAWSGKLPEAVIWDLVAYIKAISKDPQDPWSNTVSPHGFDKEQVPAEAEKTTDPWALEESFSYGRAPNQQGSDQYPTVGPRR